MSNGETDGKKVSEGLHMTEYVVDPSRPRIRGEEQIIHYELVVNPTAGFAMDLCRHFAIVAAIPDDTDRAGRQKYRQATPEEVVTRACDIAALAFDEFSSRGWLLKTQVPNNIVSEKATGPAKEH